MSIRALALSLLVACSSPSAPPTPAAPSTPAVEAPAPPAVDPLAAAVAHPDRPADDVARDGDRKPADILDFMGIEPGATVADLMAGRGYYTELLARAVGPEGVVYCQNNAFVIERFAGEALTARLARPGLGNVRRVDAELEDPGLPKGGIDVAFMGLFYHDSVWLETDRAAMNGAVFEALRPGGVYVITDHHAEAGSGVRDVKTLHRIDREVVLGEILAAGFVLDGESDVLRHADDARTANVFEDAIRGKTDRFVLRFRKPAGD